ncbi:hypothetical protein TSUD_48150 [Trifolium subterraneum]|nr:hypothetical protein TSUD_48150 [Trifolium subterraneum]
MLRRGEGKVHGESEERVERVCEKCGKKKKEVSEVCGVCDSGKRLGERKRRNAQRELERENGICCFMGGMKRRE